MTGVWTAPLQCDDIEDHRWVPVTMVEAPHGGTGVCYAVCPRCHGYTSFMVHQMPFNLSPNDQPGMLIP